MVNVIIDQCVAMAISFLEEFKKSLENASGKTAAFLGLVSLLGVFVLATYCAAISYFPERIEWQEILPLLFMAFVAGATALLLFGLTMVVSATMGGLAQLAMHRYPGMARWRRVGCAVLAFLAVVAAGWLVLIHWDLGSLPAELAHSMGLTAASWVAWRTWSLNGTTDTRSLNRAPANETSGDTEPVAAKASWTAQNPASSFYSLALGWLLVFCLMLMATGGFVIVSSTAARIAGVRVRAAQVIVSSEVAERLRIATSPGQPIPGSPDTVAASPADPICDESKKCTLGEVNVLFQGIGDTIVLLYRRKGKEVAVPVPAKDVVIVREKPSKESINLLLFERPW